MSCPHRWLAEGPHCWITSDRRACIVCYAPDDYTLYRKGWKPVRCRTLKEAKERAKAKSRVLEKRGNK